MQNKFYLLVFFISISSCTTKDISFQGIKNFDLDKTLQQANTNDKPVLLYFTSYVCVNCRKIENLILNDTEIKKKILDKFILITLVVDDREIADKNYWTYSKLFDKELKRVGEINVDLQLELTHTGNQPYFFILSKEKTILSKIGYTNDTTHFFDFLNSEK